MSTDTRAALIDAARALFAERGIEQTSMREITRAAGQRNTNALQYHFGNRDELLRALLDDVGQLTDARRQAFLGGADDPELRFLASALVIPLVQLLEDGTPGAEHLQIMAEVVARPRSFGTILDAVVQRPSLQLWSGLVEPFLAPQAVGRPLHRRFAVIRFAHTELAARARDGDSRSEHRLFTSHLIDLVAGMLTAPVSSETDNLLQPTRLTRRPD